MKIKGKRFCAKSVAGFTMFEAVIALAVLAMSIGSISSMLATTTSLSRSNKERALALEIVEAVIEDLRAEAPGEVFARFNATTLDDPATGVSPGDHFFVSGLTPQLDDPDGFVGDILFPGNGVELREDVVDVELGMSRDLNADATIDSNDHAGDYTILPLRVRARWTGASGRQSLDVVYVVTTR